MNPIFNNTDFILCSVPVPSGYPQSQTHVGVCSVGDKVLLTSSPFPSVIRSKWRNYLRAAIRKLTFGKLCKIVRGEFFENPCIYSSTDGISFNLMQSRPLMECPDAYYGLPSFNSDPDLFVENNSMYVINRAIFRTKLTPERHRDEYMIRLYLIKGLLDEGRFKYISTNLIKESTELSVSPCITKYNGKYLLLQLYTNCYNDGENFEGLRCLESDTLEGLKNTDRTSIIDVISENYIPWHMSVFNWHETLYTIVACIKKGEPNICYQMLGEFSKNLDQLYIYEKVLCRYKSYRGAAFVSPDGMLHLYTTTVNERIKGGKSVDGREVLLARMHFDKLLTELKK